MSADSQAMEEDVEIPKRNNKVPVWKHYSMVSVHTNTSKIHKCPCTKVIVIDDEYINILAM